MALPFIKVGHCNVDLKPSPIEPSWIIEGNPEARSPRFRPAQTALRPR
jgi:hypothetical protein